MEFDLDLGQWIVVGLSAFLFVWYIGANSLNRRRGIATYRWLYRCMEAVGEITHSEWIGSSGAGARLAVEKPSRPFRRVEALYLLEPREFLPYWILSYLQGKRDVVVVKITLRSVPKVTLEVEPAKGRGAKQPLAGGKNQAPERHQPVEGFHVSTEGPGDAQVMEGVSVFLRDYGAGVKVISLRQEAPHLEIRASLKALTGLPAEGFLLPIRGWFQQKGS